MVPRRSYCKRGSFSILFFEKKKQLPKWPLCVRVQECNKPELLKFKYFFLSGSQKLFVTSESCVDSTFEVEMNTKMDDEKWRI